MSQTAEKCGLRYNSAVIGKHSSRVICNDLTKIPTGLNSARLWPKKFLYGKRTCNMANEFTILDALARSLTIDVGRSPALAASEVLNPTIVPPRAVIELQEIADNGSDLDSEKTARLG